MIMPGSLWTYRLERRSRYRVRRVVTVDDERWVELECPGGPYAYEERRFLEDMDHVNDDVDDWKPSEYDGPQFAFVSEHIGKRVRFSRSGKTMVGRVVGASDSLGTGPDGIVCVRTTDNVFAVPLNELRLAGLLALPHVT